jgi:hypothetical protein
VRGGSDADVTEADEDFASRIRPEVDKPHFAGTGAAAPFA